jgi:hypothetical protein
MKLYFPHFSAADTNFQYPKTTLNHFSGAMVSVFAMSEIVSEVDPESGQTKEYNISICCFSAKHAE